MLCWVKNKLYLIQCLIILFIIWAIKYFLKYFMTFIIWWWLLFFNCCLNCPRRANWICAVYFLGKKIINLYFTPYITLYEDNGAFILLNLHCLNISIYYLHIFIYPFIYRAFLNTWALGIAISHIHFGISFYI